MVKVIWIKLIVYYCGGGFLLCTQVALGTVAYHFNFFHHLYREDTTRIGFFILGILLLTSLWVGKKVYSLKSKWAGPDDAVDQLSSGWFIAESMFGSRFDWYSDRFYFNVGYSLY